MEGHGVNTTEMNTQSGGNSYDLPSTTTKAIKDAMESIQEKIPSLIMDVVGDGVIKGIKGDPGKDGEAGPRGLQGLQGIQGPQGEPGTGSETSNGNQAAEIMIIPVSCLHSENPTEVIKAALRRGYEFIFISEYYDAISGKGTLPKKPALLTLDDGRIEQFTIAHPVILNYKVKANLFIASDFVYGKTVDSTLSGLTPLTWANLKTMNASGLWEFQNHTQTHKGLPNHASIQARKDEINECDRAIMAELGVKKPIAIAYPNGAYNAQTIKDLQECGIKLGFPYRQSYQFQTQRFATATAHPFSINRATPADGTWLDFGVDEVIYDWTYDCIGQRNASNVLGYWKFAANTSLGLSGEDLVVDSRSTVTEQITETADFYKVKKGDVIYSRLYSQSEIQTAGTAKIRLAQYDINKALISYIDIKTLTAAANLALTEMEYDLDLNCRFVKIQLQCDTSYDGLLHMRNAFFARIG